MSLYQIEVDDKAIIGQVQGILNDILNREINYKYSESGREIASAVKDLVYSRKDEIIEKVVERASREIVKKGLPKLIEKFGGNALHNVYGGEKEASK